LVKLFLILNNAKMTDKNKKSKVSNAEFIESLSNTQKDKLYKLLIHSILQLIKEKEDEPNKSFSNKSRYMGDIIKRGDFKKEVSESGEEYFVY